MIAINILVGAKHTKIRCILESYESWFSSWKWGCKCIFSNFKLISWHII